MSYWRSLVLDRQGLWTPLIPASPRDTPLALHRSSQVYALVPIVNGTEATLVASNEEFPNAQTRNNQCRFHNNVATFDDLRIVGRSGRTRAFDIIITIHTTPPQVAVLHEIIKVMPRVRI